MPSSGRSAGESIVIVSLFVKIIWYSTDGAVKTTSRLYSLQYFLDNLHMEQSQETTPEPEI